jgi:predicted AlkP superfamily pyrophosphatase or phosphodiesterase
MPALSRALLADVPADSALGRWLKGKTVADLTPSFPAVTCSVQATLTTGVSPNKHGIVANGLPTFRSPQDQELVDASNFSEYRRQISFWEQSNQFLDAPRFWRDSSGNSRWKTSLLFFQNSMPGFAEQKRPAADIVLTPKPDHGPDGKLVSLCWSQPAELVPRLFKELGPFPLMNYWGPRAGIAASQWIGKAAGIIWHEHQPQLQWVYIPHLDYDLQRFGPSSPQASRAVHDATEAVEPLVKTILQDGGTIILLSEYSMRDVKNFVQPNRILRQAGLLNLRSTPEGPLIDYEKSAAVAMVDHQAAHIYAKDKAAIRAAHQALEGPHIAKIYAPAPAALAHRRAGDLVLEAAADSWFDYRWWNESADAPKFATMIDIHRKPGYDPLELFWDTQINGISQNPQLIRGSHGCTASPGLFISESPSSQNTIAAEKVAMVIQHNLEE